MPCKKNCACRSCASLLRGLPGFSALPAGGGTGNAGVLANMQLQVATGYSPGTPLANYQFTDLQTAINYARDTLAPTSTTPVGIQLYPGAYAGNITVYDNIHLSGFGDIAQVILTGNLTYSNVAANAYLGLANFTILGTTTVAINTLGSKLVQTNMRHNGAVTYSTTVGTNIEMVITNTSYGGAVAFSPMIAHTLTTERTVEISNSIFNGPLTLGTAVGSVAVVNIRSSIFNLPAPITVGNASSASILRANNCTFMLGGTFAAPTGATVAVTAGAFANLMGSVIPQTAVTGAGTADMDLMVTQTLTINSAGTALQFGAGISSGFGTTTNTSPTGYYVVVAGTAGPVSSGFTSPTGTGVIAQVANVAADPTIPAIVTVVRYISSI